MSIATPYSITQAEFQECAQFLHDRAGIVLGPGKENLVMGRLDRRLRAVGLASYTDYLHHLKSPGNEEEAALATDLLTTNETSFFREPKHFDFIKDLADERRHRGGAFRVWSAASSTGEEAYSAAMVLADTLPAGEWEIVGTDISGGVVGRARAGLYPLEAAARIPATLLRKYCLRGRGEYEGQLAVGQTLRDRTSFRQANLLADNGNLGTFDVILLRNVMIYFDRDTKAAVVERLRSLLRPDGYLIVGLSESLGGLDTRLRLVEPSVYARNPADD